MLMSSKLKWSNNPFRDGYVSLFVHLRWKMERSRETDKTSTQESLYRMLVYRVYNLAYRTNGHYFASSLSHAVLNIMNVFNRSFSIVVLRSCNS